MGLTKQYLRYESSAVCNASASAGLAALDGSVCAVGACKRVIFWNMRSCQQVQTQECDKTIGCADFSPNRKYMVTGLSDGSIQVFERSSTSDQPVMVFAGHRTGVNCLAFTPDGLVLASGGKDSTIIVWDLVNEAGIVKLKSHKGVITCLRFVRNGQYLLSSSKDGLVKFWDMSSHSCFYSLTGHRSEIYSFITIRNDTQLVTASTEMELKVFNLKWLHDSNDSEAVDGELLEQMKRIKTEYNDDTKQDDITTDQANTIVRVRLEGSLLRQGKGRAAHVCCNPLQTLMVAVGGAGHIVDLYRIFNDEEMARKVAKKIRKAKKKQEASANGENESEPLSNMTDVEDEIRRDLSAKFSRVGEHKLGAKVKRAALADVSLEKCRGYFLLANNVVECVTISMLKSGQAVCETVSSLSHLVHTSDIRALAFSSDDLAFVSASEDSIRVWNRQAPSYCTQTMPTPHAPLCALFVTGDRHTLIGTKTGELNLYDLASSELQETVVAHEGAVWALAPSPDQKGFVSGSADKTVKFWNYELVSHEDRKQVTVSQKRILRLMEEVLCVKFSPDKKFLAVGLLDNTAKIYFVDTLKMFLNLYGHSLPVLCLDISYDGELIVTGSADKNAKIWGMDFGDCHKSLFAHDGSVTCVQFCARSHLFFSAGRDGKIKQWDGDKFERILVLEGHEGDVWALAAASSGRFLLSASHDRSIRLWEKTDEILVLHEEHENEREEAYDTATAEKEDDLVIAGETTDVSLQQQGNEDAATTELAGRKAVETVKSAEDLIEAIDVVRTERASLRADAQIGAEHAPQPLMLAYKSTNVDRFLLDVLRRVRSTDLEKCLILLPYGYVNELLLAMGECVKANYHLELANRVILFLIRIHHSQMLNSTDAQRTLESLRSVCPQKIAEIRDVIGFNLAALRFLQLDLEENQSVQLFSEATDLFKKNKKKKKDKTKQHAYIMTV